MAVIKYITCQHSVYIKQSEQCAWIDSIVYLVTYRRVHWLPRTVLLASPELANLERERGLQAAAGEPWQALVAPPAGQWQLRRLPRRACPSGPGPGRACWTKASPACSASAQHQDNIRSSKLAPAEESVTHNWTQLSLCKSPNQQAFW